MKKILPGKPYPLGASWDGEGVNFALFSDHAQKVELCLFDSPDAKHESEIFALPERTHRVWHGYVLGLRPGQLYGYRVHGSYEPDKGHRFNSHKVLLDPYAKAIGRPLRWSDELFGYRIGDAAEDLSFDERDSAAFAPLAIVTDPQFDSGADRPPGRRWRETVIYEAHVKGLTQLHTKVPEPLHGTYAGLASPPVIEHLTRLGVTAIELMPVHHFIQDRHLLERGLANYWGYNTLGFFAPEPRYHTRNHRWKPFANSKKWSKHFMRRALRSFWMWSTTTPPKATISARPCLFAAGNASYYRLVAGQSALLHGLHRLRQHAQHDHPACCN